MKFRNLIITLLFIAASLQAMAQIEKDRFHLYGGGRQVQLKGFAEAFTDLTAVEGTAAIDLGASAGIILYRQFYLGFYGQKLFSEPRRNSLSDIGRPEFTNAYIKMFHAGGVLGYMYEPSKLLHPGFTAYGGIGRIDLMATDPVKSSSAMIYDDNILVIQPKAMLEMNVTKWCKINLKAGYRFVAKINTFYTSPADETIAVFRSSDYNKPMVSFSLLLGWFGDNEVLFD